MGNLIAAPGRVRTAIPDTSPVDPPPEQVEASRKQQLIARLAPSPDQLALQDARMAICEVCPHFKRVRRNELGQVRVKCGKCGCQGLELWIEGRKCPDGRWSAKVAPPPSPETTPLKPCQSLLDAQQIKFRTNSGDASLTDLYAGWPAFLMLSGPSLATMDLSRLKQPGILTMGVNNSPKVFRPNLWTHVDSPGRFLRSIFLDPTIQKFVPTGHLDGRVFDGDAWEWTQLRAKDCPNVFGVKLTTGFDARTWLESESVIYGNAKGEGGARSVMLVALRLLYELGVRDVYLLGADFHMSKDYAYAFEQNRKKGAVNNNNRTYRLLRERFTSLAPFFAEAGFRVWNATPGSHLESFPVIDYDQAVDRALEFFDHIDVASERTEGLYDKEKPATPKPVEAAGGPKLAIGACLLNEGRYLKEWIETHEALGVRKFYLYDNDSADNTAEVLAPYVRRGLVSVKQWKTRGRQKAIYNDLMRWTASEGVRWLAVLDGDEFLFAPGGDLLGTIESIAAKHKTPTSVAGIVTHWRLFGHADREAYSPEPVIERFTDTDGKPSKWRKMICRPSRIKRVGNAHVFVPLDGHVVINERGRDVSRKAHDRRGTCDLLRINHYAVKSMEEFRQRLANGRAWNGEVRDWTDRIKEYHRTGVTDTALIDTLRRAKAHA